MKKKNQSEQSTDNVAMLSEVDNALATGRYTGERLAQEKPEIYQAIVRMLGAGMSIRQIQRFLCVHHRTVAGVEEREMPAVDAFRSKLTARVAVALRAAGDELADNVLEGKMKPGELSYAFATLFDRYQLLTGGATVRIEQIEPENVRDQLAQMLAQLPAANVTPLPDAPKTGLDGESGGVLLQGSKPSQINTDG